MLVFFSLIISSLRTKSLESKLFEGEYVLFVLELEAHSKSDSSFNG